MCGAGWLAFAVRRLRLAALPADLLAYLLRHKAA